MSTYVIASASRRGKYQRPRTSRHCNQPLLAPYDNVMALQHYLPATHLASFSLEDAGRRRDRALASGDRRNGKTFVSTAGKLGAIQNFYTVAVDDIWAAYESQLEQAVGDLIARHPSAMTWASVLVPFVACMFLRGPDFDQRFRARLEHNLGPIPEEAKKYLNTDYARVMELQRLLAPIAAAKWIVLSVQGSEDLITNDLGFAGFTDSETGETGLAIPLGRRNALGLIPRRRRGVLRLDGGHWVPFIEYRTLERGKQSEINRVGAEWAQRFIFGRDEQTVARYLSTGDGPTDVPGPIEFGFVSGPLAMVHEFAWHRLISYIQKDPNDLACLTSPVIDWQAVAVGWKPPAILPLSHQMSFMTRAAWREGNWLRIDFDDPTGIPEGFNEGKPWPS